MQDLKELNEVITAIKEEIRQGADALTTSRVSMSLRRPFWIISRAELVC